MVSELKRDAWLASDYTPLVYNYENLNDSTFEVKYYKYLEEFVNFLKLTDTLKEKYYKY